jgi:hypothetical protein
MSKLASVNKQTYPAMRQAKKYAIKPGTKKKVAIF